MGLYITHGAFVGAYSAFNRFRRYVAKASGGSYPPHDEPGLDPDRWYWGDDYRRETHPGLYEFFMHSDCDGDIPPDRCRLVADELESLVPAIERLDDGDWGHVQRAGGFAAVARQFIEGCRAAAEAGEPLEFG